METQLPWPGCTLLSPLGGPQRIWMDPAESQDRSNTRTKRNARSILLDQSRAGELASPLQGWALPQDAQRAGSDPGAHSPSPSLAPHKHSPSFSISQQSIAASAERPAASETIS